MFGPFKNQTCPVFRWLMYLNVGYNCPHSDPFARYLLNVRTASSRSSGGLMYLNETVVSLGRSSLPLFDAEGLFQRLVLGQRLDLHIVRAHFLAEDKTQFGDEITQIFQGNF